MEIICDKCGAMIQNPEWDSGTSYCKEEYGNMTREPLSKHLEDDIFEIRSKVGNEIVRIL